MTVVIANTIDLVIESSDNSKVILIFIDVDFMSIDRHLIFPSVYAEHDLSNSREQSRSRYDRKQDWLCLESCVHGPSTRGPLLDDENFWKRSKCSRFHSPSIVKYS